MLSESDLSKCTQIIKVKSHLAHTGYVLNSCKYEPWLISLSFLCLGGHYPGYPSHPGQMPGGYPQYPPGSVPPAVCPPQPHGPHGGHQGYPGHAGPCGQCPGHGHEHGHGHGHGHGHEHGHGHGHGHGQCHGHGHGHGHDHKKKKHKHKHGHKHDHCHKKGKKSHGVRVSFLKTIYSTLVEFTPELRFYSELKHQKVKSCALFYMSNFFSKSLQLMENHFDVQKCSYLSSVTVGLIHWLLVLPAVLQQLLQQRF